MLMQSLFFSQLKPVWYLATIYEAFLTWHEYALHFFKFNIDMVFLNNFL